MKKDSSSRFIMKDADVRGYMLQLNRTLTESLSASDYPAPIRSLLGEFLAAAALLSQTIKFEGRLLLQVKGASPINLIAAESSHERGLRCVARFEPLDDSGPQDFEHLLVGGTLIVTIEPDQGDRYQSLVPLTAPTLSECLEFYFGQSDQLGTQIMLHCDGQRACGFLLQQLPPQRTPSPKARTDQWQHFSLLGATLTPDEIFTLPEAVIISRLFGEDPVELFSPQSHHFACTCSRQRMASALLALGEDDLEALLEEQPILAMACEFCGAEHHLDRAAIAEQVRGNEPRH